MSLKPFDTDFSLIHALKNRPDFARPLLDLSEAVMRSEGALEPWQRELTFTYVSGRNRCGFCRESHSVVLEKFGFDRSLIDALIDQDDFERIEEKLRPILKYAKKLSEAPETLTRTDADAVTSAGWSEAAFTELNWVCALAEFFNTLVAGLGISVDEQLTRFGGDQIHAHGYAKFKSLLPVSSNPEVRLNERSD